MDRELRSILLWGITPFLLIFALGIGTLVYVSNAEAERHIAFVKEHQCRMVKKGSWETCYTCDGGVEYCR